MQSMSLALVRPLPSPVPQEIIDLADQSLKIGYRPLAFRVNKISAFHEGAAVLKNIGIGVYSPQSVERYKRIAYIKAKLMKFSSLLVCAALLSPASYYLFHLVDMTKKPATFLDVVCGIAGIVTGVLAIVSFVGYFGKTFLSDYLLEWSANSIESYEKPIPEDVLRTALTIREELPKSEMYVEELRTRKRVIDPFLYVVYKGVRLYVGVWNEPKFTGRML